MAVVIATTDRLVIRQLEPEDAAFMLELVNSPGWLRFVGDRNVHSIPEARAYLEKGAISGYELNGFGLWLLESRYTGQPVGTCGLIRRPGLEDADIGFALLPGMEGKGLAYEAAIACIQVARKLALPRLVAITTVDNTSSIRLLEKLGFVFASTVSLPEDTKVLNLYRLEL